MIFRTGATYSLPNERNLAYKVVDRTSATVSLQESYWVEGQRRWRQGGILSREVAVIDGVEKVKLGPWLMLSAGQEGETK
jgi:hypothetical protein